MRTDTPRPVQLAEYLPPAFLVDGGDLDFTLEPSATRVRSRLHLRRNGPAGEPLRLDGDRLKLVSIAIDGAPLGEDRYEVSADGLVIPGAPDRLVLDTEVEIDPAANTSLDGL